MDKSELLKKAADALDDKISNLKKLIDETRESNNDTKSSMGDKYETGREMLQQEINNLQIQLNEYEKSQQILRNIQVHTHKAIGLGTAVKTEKGLFFISVYLGEMAVGNSKLFFISPQSPLAKAMWGKAENDTFLMNGSAQKIEKIW